MRKFSDMEYDEKQEIIALFSIWLNKYTKEVINNVMERAEEIINDDVAMKMLRELAARKGKEKKDFERSIECLIEDFETFKEYDPHNHVLTHSQSYEEVLYDMYIK